MKGCQNSLGCGGPTRSLLQLQLQEFSQQVNYEHSFVAKGYSQHVNDPMVDCYAARPSTTSLKSLLLMGILAGPPDYMSGHLLLLSSTRHYRRQKRSTYNHHKNGTTTLLLPCWRLKKAMYGPRATSETMATTPWKSTTRARTTTDARLTGCLYTTTGLGVLVYVDDLLLVGETITTLKDTFTLEHVTTLSRTTDMCAFWGRDYSFTKTTQSASLWNLPTTRICCVLTT